MSRKYQVEARRLSPIQQHNSNSRLINIEKSNKAIADRATEFRAKRLQPVHEYTALNAFGIFLFNFFDWFVLLIGYLSIRHVSSSRLTTEKPSKAIVNTSIHRLQPVHEYIALLTQYTALIAFGIFLLSSPDWFVRLIGYLTCVPLLRVSKNYPSPHSDDARSFSSCFSTHLLDGFSTRGSLICENDYSRGNLISEDDYSCTPLLILRRISEENNVKPPPTSTRVHCVTHSVHRAFFILEDYFSPVLEDFSLCY